MALCVDSAQTIYVGVQPHDLHSHGTVETDALVSFSPQSDDHVAEEHSPVVPIVSDPCHKLGKQLKEDDKDVLDSRVREREASVQQEEDEVRVPSAVESIRAAYRYRREPYRSRCFLLGLAPHGAARKLKQNLPRESREAGFVAMYLTGGYVPNHSPCLQKDTKKQPAVPDHARRLMLGVLFALLGEKQEELLTLRGDRFVKGTSDYKTAAQGAWFFEVRSAEAADRLEAFSELVRLVVPAEGESCLVLEPTYMVPKASLSAVRAAPPPAGFLGATSMRFARVQAQHRLVEA